MNNIIETDDRPIDMCSTGYDYEQYQLSELENENMKLKNKIAIATKALEKYKEDYFFTEYGGRSTNPYPDIARKALKEMEGVK